MSQVVVYWSEGKCRWCGKPGCQGVLSKYTPVCSPACKTALKKHLDSFPKRARVV